MGRGIGNAGKGVDVGVTGVVQELDNPGSVLTTQKEKQSMKSSKLKSISCHIDLYMQTRHNVIVRMVCLTLS